MVSYRIARDKLVTVSAVTLESLMLLQCLLLTDSALDHFWGIQTVLATHFPISVSLATVIILQYMILIVELIARHRDEHGGLTIPLAFVPGGILARTALMSTIEAVVISLKLVVYFISVMTAFVMQILHLDRFIPSSPVDISDRILEPAERLVNRIYNLLFYNKIRTNSSVFTSFFNGCLSLWCINH